MTVPMLLLRKKIILRKLRKCGAISEESARTQAEAGVFNPNAFPKVTEKLANWNLLVKTKSGKYYLAN